MQELEKDAYLERLGVEMIKLRDCIVGVKDEKEYDKQNIRKTLIYCWFVVSAK